MPTTCRLHCVTASTMSISPPISRSARFPHELPDEGLMQGFSHSSRPPGMLHSPRRGSGPRRIRTTSLRSFKSPRRRRPAGHRRSRREFIGHPATARSCREITKKANFQRACRYERPECATRMRQENNRLKTTATRAPPVRNGVAG
jgi:hypothetical protein